ncbi:hypothetical protein [Bacteroides graminisolvens]|uniref:hypothetical protein n=1 Tax=Bacteroides graminisolvens TaxID=477666 RepID=UPI0012B60F75|nr:hypothetical protein [Bacteroides graminisolvens]
MGNRKLMKDMGIEGMGKPLGRPPKELTTGEYQVLKGLLCILFGMLELIANPGSY